ncbi:MAG: hypothetical protein GC159_21550 [Phycisphaera sp.]|nr:hypothetical protein [Phycisphaera sp.]
MKRASLTWTIFAFCLLIGLAGMSWISWRAVQLDRRDAEAQRRSDLEENVRLALWRMDSALMLMMAQENARPAAEYSPYVAPQVVWDAQLNAVPQRVLVNSPLQSSTSPFVKLHFQTRMNAQAVLDDGRAEPLTFVCPQVPPDGASVSTWSATPDRVEAARLQLDKLQTLLGPKELARCSVVLTPAGGWATPTDVQNAPAEAAPPKVDALRAVDVRRGMAERVADATPNSGPSQVDRSSSARNEAPAPANGSDASPTLGEKAKQQSQQQQNADLSEPSAPPRPQANAAPALEPNAAPGALSNAAPDASEDDAIERAIAMKLAGRLRNTEQQQELRSDAEYQQRKKISEQSAYFSKLSRDNQPAAAPAGAVIAQKDADNAEAAESADRRAVALFELTEKAAVMRDGLAAKPGAAYRTGRKDLDDADANRVATQSGRQLLAGASAPEPLIDALADKANDGAAPAPASAAAPAPSAARPPTAPRTTPPNAPPIGASAAKPTAKPEPTFGAATKSAGEPAADKAAAAEQPAAEQPDAELADAKVRQRAGSSLKRMEVERRAVATRVLIGGEGGPSGNGDAFGGGAGGVIERGAAQDNAVKKGESKELDRGDRGGVVELGGSLSAQGFADTPPVAIVEGEMQPMWVGDELMLMRRVSIGGDPYVQGVWLDWAAMRTWLLGEVGDLLPDADLRPLRGEAIDSPDTRRLAVAPIALVHGTMPMKIEPLSAQTRNTLIVTWVCVLIATIAMAILLHGVIVLSERRGDFVSAVTHELRTPLTTFRMYTGMLCDGMVSDEAKRDRYLHTLRVESDRLGHLVENVLAYARLDRGRATKDRMQSVTLGDMLDRLTERLHQRCGFAGMTLDVVCDDDARDTPLMTDTSAVDQVLFNLVENACKYASTGDDKRLVLRAATGGHVDGKRGVVTIAVEDHGPGVAPADRRRLFRAFAKSADAAANSAPGVGLGLALSRNLAKRLGGDLRLDESYAPGCRFVLTLPVSA